MKLQFFQKWQQLKHPQLVNSIDVIFVQNVEHFFTPKQHQDFLKLIEKLLIPGGYAFFTYYGGNNSSRLNQENWECQETPRENAAVIVRKPQTADRITSAS